MTKHQKSQDVIDYCLQPLDLNESSPATKEAVRRLHGAMAALRLKPDPSGVRSKAFSEARPIVINEAAHGYDA